MFVCVFARDTAKLVRVLNYAMRTGTGGTAGQGGVAMMRHEAAQSQAEALPLWRFGSS